MKQFSCFADLLISLTLEQAIAWNDDKEQWLHVDYVILSPHGFRANNWTVEQVEARFMKMLRAANIEVK